MSEKMTCSETARGVGGTKKKPVEWVRYQCDICGATLDDDEVKEHDLVDCVRQLQARLVRLENFGPYE